MGRGEGYELQTEKTTWQLYLLIPWSLKYHAIESVFKALICLFFALIGPVGIIRTLIRAPVRHVGLQLTLFYCEHVILTEEYLVARRATYVVDGRFFGHLIWKVEGSSAHTCESRAAHMCHMQLTCGKLLYGGGEPSHVAHVWQLTCTLLLFGGGEPSRVSRMAHVAINVHVTTIWWRGALMCGSHVACVEINVHVTTIWWRGALTYGSHVAINMHITTIWWRGALTCGSHVSCVAINVHVTTIWWRGPHVWLTCVTCGN